MNDEAAKPWEAIQMIHDNGISTPVLLYPNDTWVIGCSNDNTNATKNYKSDWDNITPCKYESTSIDAKQLIDVAEGFTASIKNIFSATIKLLNVPFTGQISFNSIRFYLTDLNSTFTYSLLEDSIEEEGRSDNWDVELHSESLHYLFKYPYGANTLLVNARFISSGKSAVSKMFRLSHFGMMVAADEQLSIPYLIKNSAKIISTLIKRSKID